MATMTARLRSKYCVLPFHGYVFRGMIEGIGRSAERLLAAEARDGRELPSRS